jgi:transcriptional antiterminator RfaH
LREREDENGLIRLPTTSSLCDRRQIRLLDGSFAIVIGLFESMRDSERVSVLLDLLGRQVRLLLDADAIAAV